MFISTYRSTLFFPARDDDDDDAERTRPPRTDATAHARAMPPARVARGVDRAVVQRALCAFVRARASGARDDDDGARVVAAVRRGATTADDVGRERDATRARRAVELERSAGAVEHMAVGSRAGAADAVAARHGGGDRERGGETRDARAFERDGEDGG